MWSSKKYFGTQTCLDITIQILSKRPNSLYYWCSSVPPDNAHNLLDNWLSFSQYIMDLTGFIMKIWLFLSTKATWVLVQSLVISKLDHKFWQVFQGLLASSSRPDFLHWLPVTVCIWLGQHPPPGPSCLHHPQLYPPSIGSFMFWHSRHGMNFCANIWATGGKAKCCKCKCISKAVIAQDQASFGCCLDFIPWALK